MRQVAAGEGRVQFPRSGIEYAGFVQCRFAVSHADFPIDDDRMYIRGIGELRDRGQGHHRRVEMRFAAVEHDDIRLLARFE